MDLKISSKDGFDANEEFIKIQKNGNSLILALTSFHNQLLKDKCFKIGIKEILNKLLKLIN